MSDTAAVLARYRQAFDDGDLDAIVDLHAEDAVIISRGEVCRGREEVREHYEELLEWMGEADVDLERRSEIVEGDFVQATNALESPAISWAFGVDTIVVRDGEIVGHTVAVYDGEE